MFAKRLSNIAFKFSLCGEPQWVLFNKLSPFPLMRGIDRFSDLLFSNVWSISRRTEFCATERDSTESVDCEMYLKLSSRRASGIIVPVKSPVSRRFFYKSTGNLSVSCFLCLLSSNDPWKERFEQVASSLTAGEGKFSPIDCHEFLEKKPKSYLTE